MAEEPKTYGIPLEAELINPITGEKEIFQATPKRDDFNATPSALPEKLEYRPKICLVCNGFHPREGNPICYCVACNKMGRIVWCGRCTECAYNRLSQLADIDQNIINNMEWFKEYVAWRQKQNADLVKVNKMPWEQE